MRGALLISAAGLLAFAAWRVSATTDDGGEDALWSNDWQASVDDALDTISDGAEGVLQMVGLSMYSYDKVPQQYRGAIAAAEVRYGLPNGMLARLLYQESRYRPDIISGAKKSSVGALGIAQFMPATAAQFGIDPLNPGQAIDAAGRYLGQLYKQFGTWDKALAAYNWGPGNVARKGLASAPAETRNYFTQILADLGMSKVWA